MRWMITLDFPRVMTNKMAGQRMSSMQEVLEVTEKLEGR